MRKDFNKLLCERERRLSQSSYRDVRHVKFFSQARDLDEFSDFGGREGMKSRYKKSPGVFNKDFNENLRPLKGFLRSSVGRKWDDIYSEICSTFDKRSVINQHILIHLFDYVEINIIDDDGKMKYFVPYHYNDKNGWRDINTGSFEYYVDPYEGRLRLNKNRKTYRQIRREKDAIKKAEELAVRRQLGENFYLEKENNIWYHFNVEPYQETVRYYDPAEKNYKTKIETRQKITKKQLNSKELKQYKLK